MIKVELNGETYLVNPNGVVWRKRSAANGGYWYINQELYDMPPSSEADAARAAAGITVK